MSDATAFRTFSTHDSGPRNRDPFYGATVWTIDPVLKRIADAMNALGQTSGGVARRLALMKCKGERGNPRACPVVNYLRKQRVGHFEMVLASGRRLEVVAYDGWVEDVPLPPAVEWFRMRFDRGDFPELACETSGPGDGFPRPDLAALSDAEPLAA